LDISNEFVKFNQNLRFLEETKCPHEKTSRGRWSAITAVCDIRQVDYLAKSRIKNTRIDKNPTCGEIIKHGGF
jgi:hypothetical protein